MPGDESPLGGPAEPGGGAASGGAGTLIVGYGNALRGDDALGLRAVELLADDPRLHGAQVMWRHQLTPELADDIRTASLVIFVDVSVEDEAGAVSVCTLDPAPGAGSAWSHHLEPQTLVALARELYGAAPEVLVVSVGAGSLGVGDQLSPAVERALPAAVDAVVAIVSEHGVGGDAQPSVD